MNAIYERKLDANSIIVPPKNHSLFKLFKLVWTIMKVLYNIEYFIYM